MTSASLCETCASLRRIRSSTGSVFLLCQKAKLDPRFAKYPPQPIRACPGYAPGDAQDSGS